MLTTRKLGGVGYTISPQASFAKFRRCIFASILRATHRDLQLENGEGEQIGLGVIPVLEVLQLENGGSGSSRDFDDRDSLLPLTTRQRRVIDAEDGI